MESHVLYGWMEVPGCSMWFGLGTSSPGWILSSFHLSWRHTGTGSPPFDPHCTEKKKVLFTKATLSWNHKQLQESEIKGFKSAPLLLLSFPA